MSSTGTAFVAGLGCAYGIWSLAHPGPGEVVPPFWQAAALVALLLIGGFVLARLMGRAR